MAGDSVAPRSVPTAGLSDVEARWLHDKYERLASDEGQLASTRTSYYAGIGTVLITGLIWLVANLLSHPPVLVVMVSVLAGLGITISLVWSVLLHRTLDAQNLWRECARDLETSNPPIAQRIPAPVTLRTGEVVSLDLARPFQTHDARFTKGGQNSWMDRANPTTLTELLPQTFILMWSLALVTIWAWYLFVR